MQKKQSFKYLYFVKRIVPLWKKVLGFQIILYFITILILSYLNTTIKVYFFFFYSYSSYICIIYFKSVYERVVHIKRGNPINHSVLLARALLSVLKLKLNSSETKQSLQSNVPLFIKVFTKITIFLLIFYNNMVCGSIPWKVHDQIYISKLLNENYKTHNRLLNSLNSFDPWYKHNPS